MTTKRNFSDAELDRLLAGPSRAVPAPAKERMLESVLRVSSPRPTRTLLSGWKWIAPLATAAVVAVGVFQVPTSTEEDVFSARGGELAPSFSLSCSGECVNGGKLLLRLAPAGDFTHFAAMARRSDGVLLWYQTDVPVSEVEASDGWLKDAIVLGAEHPPGEYRVYGVYSRRALGKEELRAALEGDGTDAVVIERVLSVSP